MQSQATICKYPLFQFQCRALEAATGDVLLKKVFLKISQNLQENICCGHFYKSIKKDTPAQVFSSEFCEILRTPHGDCFLSFKPEVSI